MQISNQHKLYCQVTSINRSKIVTSGVTTSGLFHRFCYGDKLQNYSEARQSLRCSIAFHQKFVAVLQLEMQSGARNTFSERFRSLLLWLLCKNCNYAIPWGRSLVCPISNMTKKCAGSVSFREAMDRVSWLRL